MPTFVVHPFDPAGAWRCVEPLVFEVGPVSRGAAMLLAGGTAAYAALTGSFALKGHASNLADRWSATAAAVVLGLLAWVLYAYGPEMLPAPFGVFLLVVYVGAIVFTLTYTLGRYKERIERFTDQAGERLNALLAEILPEDRLEEWESLRDRFTLGYEERRKTPHLLMGIFLVIYAAGFLVLRGFWNAAYGGFLTDGAGEGIENLFVATHSGWLPAGHLVALTCLLSLLYILAPTELLRLRYPELSYPFKELILPRLRERERGLFGAHYYIIAALPLVALWLTRSPERLQVGIYAVMALIAVTVFADAASALIGIRFGKHKWFHHPGKSYEGTVGGAVVAGLVALPFVGLPMALAAAAVFALVDAIGPVPIAISDNILNPIALAIAFTLGWSWLDPVLPFY